MGYELAEHFQYDMPEIIIYPTGGGTGLIGTHVVDLLRALPRDTHPMTMFSSAILAMQRESIFAEKYRKGDE